MDINDRLRKAIDKIQQQEKIISEYKSEVEKLNRLILANVKTITEMHEEDMVKSEKIKALVVENEDLISVLENAEKVIAELEHDAKIGYSFKELIKSIDLENNKPRV